MYIKCFKRLLDLSLSILLMPLVLVILTVFGLLVKLEDGGPVLYCGERLGKNGKAFRMLKLRTMKVNAPDIRVADGSTWNSENDFRVTGIGRLLRRSSLDEIPQIFNVLKGEMSIVGPRPDTTDSLLKYQKEEFKRLTVLPGITGYCQAYYRNSIDAREKIIKDIFYVENISFLLDMRILLATAVNIFRQRNIYSN